jgi:hypothetical protein
MLKVILCSIFIVPVFSSYVIFTLENFLIWGHFEIQISD